jgi:dipeptidyl aminopeptidase/acylaminoacyl peptidase
VTVAPDGSHFVDVAQTHDRAPVTYLRDSEGREVTELARSDLSGFDELGLQRVELFTFTAADGVTQLHGMLHKPSNFDPSGKYPVLVSVYAGPGSNGARERFTVPNPLTEYGFLVVSMDSRSASGRGKRFMDSIYLKLGVVEVDDQAAGVWIPQENEEGYDAGSAMTHVDDLEGRLMLYYGTADNNVHPSNTMQLISALQRAGKSFEVQVGPVRGHSGLNRERMMEFFIENLVIREAG